MSIDILLSGTVSRVSRLVLQGSVNIVNPSQVTFFVANMTEKEHSKV